MSTTMFISMQRQTGSKQDERLARSLAYQRTLDALAWKKQRFAQEEHERRWGDNDNSGRQSLMKAMGSPPRVTALTSWVRGVPAAPWRDYPAMTERYAPRQKKRVKPAYATV
jgi:hypothetical protein